MDSTHQLRSEKTKKKRGQRRREETIWIKTTASNSVVRYTAFVTLNQPIYRHRHYHCCSYRCCPPTAPHVQHQPSATSTT